MKDYHVKNWKVRLEPSKAGAAGYFVWWQGFLRGEVFRGAFGRYWWATPTGQPPYHQADDLGAAIEVLCIEGDVK